MAEEDLPPPQASADESPDDASSGVGARLRRAREAQGLSRADIAARTKIAERHLAAIEEARFGDLASSTYAVGFSRAYARAVGLDEREIAQAVRDELDMADQAPSLTKPTFEPGDPARVPSIRTAWVAGAAGLAVIAAVAVFFSSYIFPAVSLPDLTRDAPPEAAASEAPVVTAPTPAPATQGPVVVTAMQDGVWVKVTDASGKQLFQKEMKRGESYTVPADAPGPQLRTAWPDALGITVGGRPVPPLADKRTVITVPISAAALLARGVPSAPPAAQPVPSQPAPATASPAATPTPRPAASARPSPTPTQAARPASPPSPAASPAAASPAPAASPALVPAAAPAEAPKASPVSQ